MSNAPLISLVVPCYNEEDVFPLLREALLDTARRLEPRCRAEFVLVDDGSRDSTWKQIVDFACDDRRVRAVSFSRNFGHQAALTCGYDLAQGDAVVSMDADLQDPPETVLELVRKWEERDADIVYAVRSHREGEDAFKRWTAAAFYHLFQRLGVTGAPLNSGDFRLMSARAVAGLRNLREQHRYVRGMVGWLGFRTARVLYERKPRQAGVTKYPLRKMLAFAMDAIISFSSFPLRLSYFFACLAAIPVVLYLGYLVIRHVIFQVPLVPGWSSLILTVTLFGFLMLFCLGIMGEYIGRIYDQAKSRPLYLIREILQDGRAHSPNDPSKV